MITSVDITAVYRDHVCAFAPSHFSSHIYNSKYYYTGWPPVSGLFGLFVGLLQHCCYKLYNMEIKNFESESTTKWWTLNRL